MYCPVRPSSSESDSLGVIQLLIFRTLTLLCVPTIGEAGRSDKGVADGGGSTPVYSLLPFSNSIDSPSSVYRRRPPKVDGCLVPVNFTLRWWLRVLVLDLDL